jgi:error-prone DNA polymerase
MEDESGQINLIIWKTIAEEFRAALLNARLLGIAGELQIEGKVIHVIAHQLFDHTEMLGGLSLRSRDFR